jgi:hypothetical protein
VVTNRSGEAAFDLPAGTVDVSIERYGFKPHRAQASIVQDETTRVVIDLEAESVSNEEITVTATRTETRIEVVWFLHIHSHDRQK